MICQQHLRSYEPCGGVVENKGGVISSDLDEVFYFYRCENCRVLYLLTTEEHEVQKTGIVKGRITGGDNDDNA